MENIKEKYRYLFIEMKNGFLKNRSLREEIQKYLELIRNVSILGTKKAFFDTEEKYDIPETMNEIADMFLVKSLTKSTFAVILLMLNIIGNVSVYGISAFGLNFISNVFQTVFSILLQLVIFGVIAQIFKENPSIAQREKKVLMALFTIVSVCSAIAAISPISSMFNIISVIHIAGVIGIIGVVINFVSFFQDIIMAIFYLSGLIMLEKKINDRNEKMVV